MHVKFEGSEPIADHIKSFYFKPEKPLRYVAGQFIELTLPHDNPDQRGTKHWFTLSSSPTEALLAITTKFPREHTSTFKKTLERLTPGEQVLMSDAMGDFVLPVDETIPLTFIAGGIGITPLRSMIKSLLDEQQQRSVHLLYTANTLEEVAFRELFASYGLPATIILSNPPDSWEGETGRLTADSILSQSPDVDDKLYYLSGPEPMVETLIKDLEGQGVEKHRLVGDYFPNYAPL